MAEPVSHLERVVAVLDLRAELANWLAPITLLRLSVCKKALRELFSADQAMCKKVYETNFAADKDDAISLAQQSTDPEDGFERCRLSKWFRDQFVDQDWYIRLSRRCNYNLQVKKCIKRGASGFLDMDGPNNTLVLKDKKGYNVKITSNTFHHIFIHIDPLKLPKTPVAKVLIPSATLDEHEQKLLKHLRYAFLSLTKPDTMCVSLEQEHRYEYFFPHVAESLGNAFGDTSEQRLTEEFFAGGEYVVTSTANLKFGISSISYRNPCEFWFWGDLVPYFFGDNPTVQLDVWEDCEVTLMQSSGTRSAVLPSSRKSSSKPKGAYFAYVLLRAMTQNDWKLTKK